MRIKNRIILLILLLFIPVSLIFAAAELSSGLNTSSLVYVETDLTNIPNSTAIGFANSTIGELYSSYDEKASELCTEFVLDIGFSQDGTWYAKSKNDLYIRWKIYTNQQIEIQLKSGGAMASDKKPELPVNWKIELTTDVGQFCGSDLVIAPAGSYDKKITVFSSTGKNTALSGAAGFRIKTQPLDKKYLDIPYSGLVVAEVWVN